MAKTSEAQLKANAKFLAKFEKIKYRVSVGQKEKVFKRANSLGLSKNSYNICGIFQNGNNHYKSG